MDDGFEIVEPQDAQQFLGSFPLEARQAGEQASARGDVGTLVEIQPGRCYVADVRGATPCRVQLSHHPAKGWRGECACPSQPACQHVYAVMATLLAEHRTNVVRKLSAGLIVSKARPIAKADAVADDTLARKLESAKGAPLTRQEDTFLKRIGRAFNRYQKNRQFTHWDYQDLGFSAIGLPWGPIQLWPSPPASEYEFWLGIASSVIECGEDIPEFMEPITDRQALEEAKRRWKRNEEIEGWKHKLGQASHQFTAPASQAGQPIDLRLAIGEKSIQVEWRQPGKETFEALKSAQVKRLANEAFDGTVQFTAEADLIWEYFCNAESYNPRYSLNFNDSEAPSLMGRLLRMRALESRIVTADGKPLERPAEPLRWELISAAGEEDDYRLRLVQANGAPAPQNLITLPGHPALYLSAHALFTGPDAQPHILDSRKENRIPAPALEQASGVAFLRSLAIELPSRLRDRVRVLPYQVHIACSLRQSAGYGRGEECFVKVTAVAEDGHRMNWNGADWVQHHGGGRHRSSAANMDIVTYDRTALSAMPALLDPLNLKAAYYADFTLTARVTKKFPEVFAGWLKSIPPEIKVTLEDDLASLANADVAGHVQLEVTEVEIDWFDLRVALSVADTTLTKEEVRLLLAAKGGYVRLAGKGWRRLQYDLSQEEDERLARLGLSTRQFSDEPQRLHALQLADESARKFLPEQQVEQIQRRASEIKARVTPALPPGVQAELRPYQLDGFHFLAYLSANRFGGILADDMGLGKTLQALVWLLWLRETDGKDASRKPGASPAPSLVVCPKSVMDNWHAEAAHFAPRLRVKAWSASELETFADRIPEADLHVVNYSQLRSVAERFQELRWQSVILDEGQYIKNPNSLTARAARSLRTGHRLVLSGTPIENRLLDLWSLMSFVMPGVLGNRTQFARLYNAKDDPLARKRLASRVRPFVLRRTKAQVAKDLPDRIEEDLFCEIEGEQKTLYQAELKRARLLLLGIKTQQELAQHQFNFLTSLLRLRQICCHPRLLKPDSKEAGAKSEALLEQLEPLMEEGQKVLVFSQFVELLNLLQPALEERNWPVFYLAGHTENRGDLVRDFQSAEGPAVFLISLKAGGFGLNLTSASYVVLFDPWWNPAVENQAIDRTHRIGQTNKVIAYRLLIKNSVEEKIRELQKHKKALAEDVFGEEKFSQSLTLQDLQFLFSD